MVKILPIVIPDILEAYMATISHWGTDGPADPHTVHAIYAFPAIGIPPDVTAYYWTTTLDMAWEVCRDWLAMPQVCKDVCSLCRYGLPGPSIPRWNIYRGQSESPVPVGIIWNMFDGDPPWP